METLKKHILKFGGSSLENSDLIRQSVQIVIERTQTAQPFVVVSALKGVTDTLIQLTESKSENIDQQVDNLRNKHLSIFDELVDADERRRKQLNALFDELQQNLSKLDEDSDKHRARIDEILSIGERASTLIFAAALSQEGIPAESFEAHQFIKTDSTFGKANVQFDASQSLIRKFLDQSNLIPVVTGFIGSDDQNRITTLGRSGSDYTAGLLAGSLDADHLEIWTDVNGVLSADPRWVSTAQPISALSFGDITELSAHGAKVIHPQTIQPINNKKTSVLVKNSYNPTHPGTSITSGFNSNGSLKTITITGPFVRLQIDEQQGYDLLSKLKTWLDGEPDSETIGFERSSDFEPARFLLRQSFFDNIADELAKWSAEQNVVLDLEANLYKVKKFSNYFSKDEKLTQQLWNLLVDKGLQPINADRNRDEHFISFLFKEKETQLAARLINDYLQGNQPVVDLFVAGTGAVGKTLLDQLKTLNTNEINIRLIGACNSKNTFWDETGIDLSSDLHWSGSEKTDWEIITEKLTQPYRHNLIFVDATGSEEVARLYPTLLKSGANIVTPSKLANTFEQSFFDELQLLVKKHNASFRYETTVGAGLPVLSTIKDLQTAGDEITEISGVVSGTMTYLFNQLEQGVAFSDAIVEARKLGYAEPDPRDDLSGEDVARKFLTLARTLGLKIERNELEVESLVPEELLEVDRKTFLKQLSDYDQEWQQRIRTANKRDEVLRYTGRLKNGKINIGIESVSKDSPIGQLKGTDNLIQIYSRFYNKTPLVIQGPGAGKEVTAAGVLSDILKTTKELIH